MYGKDMSLNHSNKNQGREIDKLPFKVFAVLLHWRLWEEIYLLSLTTFWMQGSIIQLFNLQIYVMNSPEIPDQQTIW